MSACHSICCAVFLLCLFATNEALSLPKNGHGTEVDIASSQEKDSIENERVSMETSTESPRMRHRHMKRLRHHESSHSEQSSDRHSASSEELFSSKIEFDSATQNNMRAKIRDSAPSRYISGQTEAGQPVTSGSNWGQAYWEHVDAPIDSSENQGISDGPIIGQALYKDQTVARDMSSNNNNKHSINRKGSPGNVYLDQATKSDSFDQYLNDQPSHDLLDLDLFLQGQRGASRERDALGLESGSGQSEVEYLKELVLQLRDQLQDSHTDGVVTRSVLNTLEEKQDAQARDLQSLKDEVTSMRKQQIEQRQLIATMQSELANYNWGVQDIKEVNDQMSRDFTAIKELQLAHNSTMNTLSDLTVSHQTQHAEHTGAISQLDEQVRRMRTELQHDRAAILDLQTSLRKSQSRERELSNNIPIFPTVADYLTSSETSGVGSNSQEYQTFDELASTLEESQNIIGDHITRLVAKEEQIDQELYRMRSRFSGYDNRLTQLHNFFLNMSLQISNTEKIYLANQNADTQRGADSLQEIAQHMLNFTERLVHLQHWSQVVKPFVNRTWNNSHVLDDLETVLDAHAQTILSIEEQVRGSSGDHEALVRRLREVERYTQSNDLSITKVQLALTNNTLQSCQESAASAKLELSLQDLESKLRRLERRVEGSDENLYRMERGLTKVFEQVDKQGTALTRSLESTSELLELPATVEALQASLHNLLLQLPTDCNSVRLDDPGAQSGVYLIYPQHSGSAVRVACEFEPDTSWTVVQRRFSGNLSFERNWEEYRSGFGDPDSEFWLGTEQLHYLTSQDSYQLCLDMQDLSGDWHVAQYDSFRVGGADDNYKLMIGGFHGNATDALVYSNNMPFSTIDRDNDVSSTNCARFYTAGWWYKHCHYANLNGRYTVGIVWFSTDIDQWLQMKATTMKIRPFKQQGQYNPDRNRVTSLKN